MKIDRISYQKIIPIAAYCNERIGLEASLEEGENPEFAMANLKHMVEGMATNPSYGNVHEIKPVDSGYEYSGIAMPEIKHERPETKIDGLIATINYCDKLVFLEKFRATVEKENDPRLTDAFEKRIKELQ